MFLRRSVDQQNTGDINPEIIIVKCPVFAKGRADGEQKTAEREECCQLEAFVAAEEPLADHTF